MGSFHFQGIHSHCFEDHSKENIYIFNCFVKKITLEGKYLSHLYFFASHNYDLKQTKKQQHKMSNVQLQAALIFFCTMIAEKSTNVTI